MKTINYNKPNILKSNSREYINGEIRTLPSALKSFESRGFSAQLLFFLLTLLALVKVLDDDSDEHVEHKEADEQQERDEVEQAPLVVVHSRLTITVVQYVHTTIKYVIIR